MSSASSQAISGNVTYGDSGKNAWIPWAAVVAVVLLLVLVLKGKS